MVLDLFQMLVLFWVFCLFVLFYVNGGCIVVGADKHVPFRLWTVFL